MRSPAIFSTLLGALVLVSACGSDVDLPSGAGTTGSGAGSTTSGSGAGSATSGATTGATGAGSGSTGSSGAGAGSGSTGSSGAGAGSGSTGSSGAGAGTGSSSASSGSSGGTPPSKACSECAQLAIEGPCQAQFDACQGSFACTTLLDCHSKCEWTDMCNADCDQVVPSGVPLLSDLLGCVACEQCLLPCAGSTLSIYCP